MFDNFLEDCFPNIEIALRIYLSLMVTNCRAERSFLKLGNVKNVPKPGLHELQLPVERSVTLVSSIVVERRRCFERRPESGRSCNCCKVLFL